MDYRYLGRSGLKVSALALGAMTFGRESDENTSYAVLDRFAEAGGTLIDTANVYGPGTSETIVGRWLAKRDRDRFIVASKVRFPMGDGPNQVGLSRKHILASVEASLERLGGGYLDLLQIHGYDPGTPFEETLSTLDDLVRAGLVRYLGASNLSGWQLQKMLDLAREHGFERFVSLQPQYNLLCRSTEWELIEVAKHEGLGVLPWGPLRGGWLSGRYHREMTAPPANSRVETAEREGWGEAWSKLDHEETWKVVDALHEVAAEAQKSPAQVALNWLLHRPTVTAPILGARHLEHLDDNLGALGWHLTDTQRQKLDDASLPTLPYPYNFIAEGQVGRER